MSEKVNLNEGQNQTYKDRPDAWSPAKFATMDEKERLIMHDTLSNLVTGLGTSYDKRMAGGYQQTRALRYDHPQLTALYRENWVAGKIVDAVPEDMTRTWRRLSSDELTPEDIEKFEDQEQELKVQHYFHFAHKMARLYGGSLIVMDIEGTGEPETPLNINMVKPGSFRHMKVVDLTRIIPAPNVITNPLDPKYGQPEFYRFAESGVRVHSSRCIRFDGVELPFFEYRRNAYWHDSILNRLYDSVRNMDTVTESSASLVYESNVDVVGVNGLMDYLQSPAGTALLTKKMQLQKALKSTTNQTIIDKDDEYKNVTKQFTGLPSLIDRFLVMLTAGSDVPAGRLLGDSASAFNVTGQASDLKNYYDGIESKQVIEYNPKLRELDKILAINLGWGNNKNLKFEWNSLFQTDPEQEAKAEKARAEVFSLLHNNKVMKPSQIAEELQGNPYFTSITKELVDELKVQDEFDLEIENGNAIADLEAKQKNNEQIGKEESSEEGESKGGSSEPKKSKTNTDKAGSEAEKPDKQLRDMKPEETKENKRKNRDARSRGTDKNDSK